MFPVIAVIVIPVVVNAEIDIGVRIIALGCIVENTHRLLKLRRI